MTPLHKSGGLKLACARPCTVPAALTPKFCVEARSLTRRESVEKRHKRIRSKVRRQARQLVLACSPTQLGCTRQRSMTGSRSNAACGALTLYLLQRLQVEGTTERPRLAVFRSNNHIYAQVGGAGRDCVTPAITRCTCAAHVLLRVQQAEIKCQGSVSPVMQCFPALFAAGSRTLL